jgi:Ca2+:H+ antiporter
MALGIATGMPYPEKHCPSIASLRQSSLRTPKAPLAFSLVGLLLFCCFYVVSAIFVIETKSVPVKIWGISKSFMGLIVMPQILLAPQAVKSCIEAKNDKVNHVVEESLASCLRIALFILPFLVILSWTLNISGMTLFFDGFQVTIFSLCVIHVNYLVQGHATW